MAAKHTLHVALTAPLVQHVRNQVAVGRYSTASELVRRALLLLIEQEVAESHRPALPPIKASLHSHG